MYLLYKTLISFEVKDSFKIYSDLAFCTITMFIYLFEHFQLQQAVLESSHNKVMRLVFIVNNVFQADTILFFHLDEEILIVLKRNPTDLVNASFFYCVIVHKVTSNTNCKCTFHKENGRQL